MSDDEKNELDPMVDAIVRNAEMGDEPRVMAMDAAGRVVGIEELDNLLTGDAPEDDTEGEVIDMYIDMYPEGTAVSVTAPVGPEEGSPELTLIGVVCGVTTVPAGFGSTPAYVVKLDDPSLVPANPDGDEVEYSCLVFPYIMVEKV